MRAVSPLEHCSGKVFPRWSRVIACVEGRGSSFPAAQVCRMGIAGSLCAAQAAAGELRPVGGESSVNQLLLLTVI